MGTRHYSIQCIERAIDFIASELAEERVPELSDIASNAGLSKFHFHRLYTLITGETCHDTITRLRLARAADMLKNTKQPVTDIALSAGYGSSQAFAKALQRHTEQTATALRQDPERLGDVIADLSTPTEADGGETPAIRVELASFAPFEVITIATEGRYPNLNETYWSLFAASGDPAHVEAILGLPGGDVYAPQASSIAFDCALKLSAVPAQTPSNVLVRHIPGGAHLVARNLGAYEGLPATLDALYVAALSDPQVRIADRPAVFHYLDDPEDTEEGALRTDVYLAISLAEEETQ